MKNVKNTIILQYINSDIIVKLIDNMNEYFDPTTDFDNFFYYVWNIKTAKGFGLDIWGRIVNISRYVRIPGDNKYFGFAGTDRSLGFNQAPFFDEFGSSDLYALPDDYYRTLILLKAFTNITRVTEESINKLLSTLFKDKGKAYIVDLGNMEMEYVFEFELTDIDRSIIQDSGAFPKPSGVSVKLPVIPKN